MIMRLAGLLGSMQILYQQHVLHTVETPTSSKSWQVPTPISWYNSGFKHIQLGQFSPGNFMVFPRLPLILS